ncbi:restriction endonuclease subunit S [Enterococcus faecium]|nr:restriction endonuclease subunit S [Enterococcus faecium]EGP5019600.1 restriction endonuclease subunit S [Enterococcus faecium]
MSNDTRPEIRFPGFTEDWEQRKLGEVVESVGTGRSTFTNGIVQTSETPYAVLGSTSVISYDSMFDHSGDFILTARVGANAGNLYKYFGEVKISDNTVYIQANNLDFIYYLLTKYDLKRLSFGTGQPLVKASEVKNLKLNFPQKNEEQQKIGSFFKQLDDTIALHQRKLDLLKETKKGFLQKMFPKNGAKVPEIRFPGFTEDWEQRKLGQVANYRRGSFPQPYGNKEWYDGENSMPFVQVVDVGDNLRLVEDTKQKISELAQPKSVFVEEGKVVVTLQGSIGRVAITQYPAYVDRTLLIFESYKAEMDEYYFAYVIQQLFEYEKTRAPGGTIKTITKEALSNFTISFPSIAEQKKLGKFFEQLDDTIALHQRKLDLLKETKKGFLQKMFV